MSADLTATEIGLLTELYWGVPLRSYSRTRAWTDAQFDEATDSLQRRGLVENDSFTAAGRDERERIEVLTDQQMAPAIAAIGDDIDELFAILEPWGAAVREGRGYLPAGPHDLARAASRSR